MIGISAFNNNYEGFYRTVRVLDIIQDIESNVTLDLSNYKFKAVALQCTSAATGEAYLTFHGDDTKTVTINIVNYSASSGISPLGFYFPGVIRKITIPPEAVTITPKNFKVYLLS